MGPAASMAGVAERPLTTVCWSTPPRRQARVSIVGEGGAQAAGSRCAPVAGIRREEVEQYLEAQYPVQLGMGAGRSADTRTDGDPSADGAGEDQSAAVSGSDGAASVGSAGGTRRSGGGGDAGSGDVRSGGAGAGGRADA